MEKNVITGEMLLNKQVCEIPSLLEPLLPKTGLKNGAYPFNLAKINRKTE